MFKTAEVWLELRYVKQIPCLSICQANLLTFHIRRHSCTWNFRPLPESPHKHSRASLMWHCGEAKRNKPRSPSPSTIFPTGTSLVRVGGNPTVRSVSASLRAAVAGVCADLLLLDQRNSVGIINGGRGGVGNIGR